MESPRYRRQLRRKLDEHFDKEELRLLCFDLGVDFDNLPGDSKATKAMELVALMERAEQIAELVAACEQLRQEVVWQFQARLFISYKRHVALDSSLAVFLQQDLSERGHQIFIDQTMRAGTAWLEEIDQQIKGADFLVVLLSKESADSEMVQSEIRRAHDYRRQQGHPHLLPVRLAYEELLPYTIDAFLSPYQYIAWQDEDDNERLTEEILAAIQGRLGEQRPLQPVVTEADITVSEDGRILADVQEHTPPLPQFDPRIIEELAPPGGTVSLRDRLYVERNDDMRLRQHVMRPGSIATIRASRQTGKSSLLVRGIQYARQQGARVVNLDLQRVDRDHLAELDSFLNYLANMIVHRLRLNPDEVERAWQGLLGAQDKLTDLMETYILPEASEPIVLGIDEADRLLETEFYTDFFGLIRSWHNSSAYDPVWEMLRIVMVISTEPYLLISDISQSPFNVGLKLYLEDFSTEQVQDLNQRHGEPVGSEEFSQFMNLLGGHPYLTRKALYNLVAESQAWPAFRDSAPSDSGPFGDHLRRQLWLLRDEPDLQNALRQVIQYERCDDDVARFRLLRAGLIKGSGDYYACRNDLYRIYFREKL
jgi:hypothetical protein